ncbi:MAG: hypothetical protein JWM64_1873 [Frankiales bacterium]|nr:hypothetical protein [Frankiales bacterium]
MRCERRLVPGQATAGWPLVLLAAAVLLCGCGSSGDDPEQAAQGTDAAAAPAGASSVAPASSPPTAGGAGTEDACPVTAAEISSTTTVPFVFQLHEAEHPDEVDPSLRSSLCIFTTAVLEDEYGDPYTLRTDEYVGAAATAAATAFCTGNEAQGLRRTPAGPGRTTCVSQGLAGEGQVSDGPRTVQLGLVAGDKAITSQVSAGMARLLDAAAG